MISFPSLQAQVVRDGYLMPAWAKLLLDVVSSLNKFSAPTITTTQRDAIVNAANGMIIYNTTADKFQGYQAGVWVDIS